jgi:hypothetical protein
MKMSNPSRCPKKDDVGWMSTPLAFSEPGYVSMKQYSEGIRTGIMDNNRPMRITNKH